MAQDAGEEALGVVSVQGVGVGVAEGGGDDLLILLLLLIFFFDLRSRGREEVDVEGKKKYESITSPVYRIIQGKKNLLSLSLSLSLSFNFVVP